MIMARRFRRWLYSALSLGAMLLPAGNAAAQDKVDTTLQNYVHAADSSFAWTQGRTWSSQGVNVSELRLTSQTWHGAVWRHLVYVARPAALKYPADAMLLIEDGRWKDASGGAADTSEKPPGKVLAMGTLALKLQAPMVMVTHVPPQPLFENRNEDDALAYSFQKFLNTDVSDWPLLLPMTKSVVRAMDAVDAHARKNGQQPIERYLVTGASKRGWATWLTAVVDQRVAAIAPAIFDSLNFDAQLSYQNRILGAPSARLSSFKKYDVLSNFDSPRGKILEAIVDPYQYRSLITQPKIITLGTNDPYWTTDSLNLYWDGLRGPKYIVYLPNAGHGSSDKSRYYNGLAAQFSVMCGEGTMPRIAWTYQNEGRSLTLRVECDTAPMSVQAWTATAPTADLRSAKWTSQSMTRQDDAYIFHWEPPAGVHGAIYGELTLPHRFGSFNLATAMRRIEP